MVYFCLTVYARNLDISDTKFLKIVRIWIEILQFQKSVNTVRAIFDQSFENFSEFQKILKNKLVGFASIV